MHRKSCLLRATATVTLAISTVAVAIGTPVAALVQSNITPDVTRIRCKTVEVDSIKIFY